MVSCCPGACVQRRAGPKGHGLYTEEDLAAGQFVIQYVGEVLEEEEYLRRKHYYIQTGQRHYYFMNIGNGEVIDACRKVRNHSNSGSSSNPSRGCTDLAQHRQPHLADCAGLVQLSSSCKHVGVSATQR